MIIDPNKKYTATIHTTLGDMTAELFAEDAPKTVNNFVFLARDGFYKNIKFYFIKKGFVVQTGDPTGTGIGGPGYQFPPEPNTKNYARGVLSMSNYAGKSDSRFFIMHGDYPFPKSYSTIFGQLTGQSSLEVLDKIAATPVRLSPTGENYMPTKEVIITGIDITP